jgi:glycosyltransferase involved in cell wall biosynthesis
MRITYIHQYFNSPSLMGGTRSYEMARRFVEAGHSVDLISTWRDSGQCQKAHRLDKIDGIRVHWLDIPYSNHMGYPERIRAFLSFALAASRKAVQIKADIVFATSTPLTVALPGVYAAKRLKVPMVFEVRDLWPEVPIAIGALKNPLLIASARWLERFAYRNSAHIVALSPGMADGVVRTGFPSDRVSVIPNCCNIESFQVSPDKGQDFLKKHPQLLGGPLVVYTGTLGMANGVTYLVDIAHAMRDIDSNVRFLIVGDGKEIRAVESRARELDVLNKTLWMLPAVSKHEIPAILSSATVATSLFKDLPELWHNSANKFFDALAAGRPIMVNYQGWQADLLSDSGAGISVPPTDLQSAAKTLHSFLADENRLRKARQASTKLAKSMFDQNDLARKLLSILVQESNSKRIGKQDWHEVGNGKDVSSLSGML